MALADVPNTVIDDFFPVTLKANEVLNKINLQENPSAMTMLVDKLQLP